RLHISLPRGQRSALVVGLLNGLMPCGPLQSMQLFALSAGGWLMGALSMLAFSLGTVPLMLGAGILGGRLNRRFARPVNIASAGLVALMGLNMLTNGLSLAGVNLTAGVPGTAAQVNDNVQKIYTELDYGSYPSITVQAGVPVEWTIHADARKINGCNNEIIIPACDMTIPLEPGDNVISFTPDTSGVIAYSCWMGMIRGSITVVDSADA
ncbi:MAG: sulfite exporter TauE/SafE family protein, partial [Clostridiales bacterium]|nr:sulfite exporter TauE/SafE family protein [Clostridiales bacterium]